VRRRQRTVVCYLLITADDKCANIMSSSVPIPAIAGMVIKNKPTAKQDKFSLSFFSRGQRLLALQAVALCVSAAILLCVLLPRTSSSSESELLSSRTLSGVSSRSTSRRFLPPRTEQEDIFISVKTSRQFHESRLEVVVKTWFQLGREQIWFFTDAEDERMQEKTSKLNPYLGVLHPS
jgi:hypothetical protein